MKLSVITVNYNDAEGLERTIYSVISQSFHNSEYIIIDGGSTDGSVDVIKKYEHQIKYWVSEPDEGVYAAMNKGVVHASGEYCIFMNSGDSFFDSNTLEKVFSTNLLDDIIVGDAVSYKTGEVVDPRPVDEISLYHLYSGSIPHQGAFIKTKLLLERPYDENLKIVSDWKFFLQAIVLNNCSFRYLDFVVAKYDLNGISSRCQKELDDEKEKVLKSILPPRILYDYKMMKSSECLTQKLTPQLRLHYRIDKIMYRIGCVLLHIFKKVE